MMMKIIKYAALIILVAALVLFAYMKGKMSGDPHAPPNHYTKAQLAMFNSDAKRLLAIDGTRNFRDLGGYETKDGRRVKWGMVYRSDNLAHLDEAGLAAIDALNLRSITDLRSAPERMQEADILPDSKSGIVYQTLPINDEPVDIHKLGREIITGEVNEEALLLLLDHRRFIDNPKHRESWGGWLRALGEPQRTPHLFHCTSGKDRTGYGAAIFLLTLGVPKETVQQDFLLSNQVLDEYITQTIEDIDRKVPGKIDKDLFRKIMGVSQSTIEATFAQMEVKFGSIDNFIEQGLGIDAATRAHLQEKFLQ